MIPLPRKALVAAVLIPSVVSFGGQMDVTIGTQVYRDLAENRGIYQPGSTVTIYDLNGVPQGSIANIMNFDNSCDIGQAALVGGSQFMLSVTHDNNTDDVTFTQRFGAVAGTPFYDAYQDIGHAKGYTDGSWNYKYDVQVVRLNKVVTEATAAAYLTDTTVAANLQNYQIMRVGAGTQFMRDYAANLTTQIDGAYKYLNAGTVGLSSVEVVNPTNEANRPASSTTGYAYTQSATTDPTTLPLPIYLGDSGSPIYVFNPNTNRWEFAGAASWVAYGTGPNGEPITGGSRWTTNPGFIANAQAAYVSPTVTTSGASNILWNTPDANGSGTITQGATNWNYNGLSAGLHGATSTTSANGSGTAASDAQMDATRDLVFSGTGGTIVLGGSVDMGAGSLTFNSNFTLSDGGVNTRRLNSAGYIVNAGATLTTTLTGASGDEWRKIGDGKMIVSGSGNNLADLNLGGGGIVELNRTGGYAANNVKINGGGVLVRLVGANQIGGEVIFGHRGGTLDLYGHNFTDAAITHLDSGANIANLKANTTTTFTFTGSGSQNYLGDFSDGGSLANGLLNVNYNPGTPAGAVWSLSGIVVNKGAFTVSAGELRVAGVPTLHADNYVDPNDWQTAIFDTGSVSVASGATFTAGAHATVNAAVSVAGGGTFQLLAGANHTGAVALTATNAAFVANITSGSVTESGAVTGAGSLTKSGVGTLNLTNAGNSFSGAKNLNAGTLTGSSLAALGDTTTNKWNVATPAVIAATGATAAQLKAKLTTGSTGTLALAGTNPDAAPDMTGYAGLYLGALGAQTVGTAGTSTTLTAWNGSGWNLGGGGGTLTMNLKLSGAGTLNIGNGQNVGTVVLTNANNNTATGGAAFTGAINVNSGVSLRYTDINALGAFSGSDRITVGYGAQMALGSGANAVAVFNAVTTGSAGVLSITGSDTNAYSFSAQGLNSAALGADGTATYSGTLTAGTGGYKFGGNGALTVSSVLSGTNALSADGQGTTGGVTTLSGANTFTGAVTVQGGTANGILGSHTLKLGSNNALGSGNAVTLNDGGIVDLNGKASTFGALTGTAASALKNSSASASTLTVSQSGNTTMAGAISGTGALNLVKSGTGTLTLSGDNSQSGTLAINGGVIKLGSNTALGDAANAVSVASGAALDINGRTIVNSGAVTLTGSGIGSAGALLNSSTGRAYLKNVTLAGDTTIANTSAQGDIVIGSTTAQDGTLNLAGYTLTKNGTGTLAINGVNMTGAGNIVINAGTLQLMDDYSGGFQKDTTLAGTGTITVNSGGTLSTQKWGANLAVSMSIILNGGTLGSSFPGPNGANIASNISLAADSTLAFNGGYGNVTLSGIISGTHGLTVGGDTNTRTLTGANTYTGNTTLTGGTLLIGDAGYLGGGNYAGALSLGSGTTFNYGSSANQTLSGVISGAGSLIQSGTGTTTLSGNNTYTGTTTVNAGTLSFGATGPAGGLANISQGGFTVNGGMLRFATTFRGTTFSAGTGAGSGITVNTGGTLDLYQYNDGVSNIAWTLPALTLNGGTLSTTAGLGTTSNTIAANIALGSGTTSAITAAAGGYNTNITLGGVISGSGSITFNTNLNTNANGGVISLTGANTYTGATTIAASNGGAGVPVVQLGDGGATGSLSVSSAISVGSGANFGVKRSNATTQGVDFSGSAITGAGGFIQAGSGTTTLTADNTYAGTTRVNAGTLQVGNGGAAGTLGSGAVANNAAIVFKRSDSATIANTISGSGTLTFNGTGVSGQSAYKLTGDNSGMSGAITATNARAEADNSAGNRLGTGALTTGAGGQFFLSGGTFANAMTLSGNGWQEATGQLGALRLSAGATVSGPVTLAGDTRITAYNGSGVISGAIGETGGARALEIGGAGQLAGTVTLSGNNTYTGTTTISSGTLQIGSVGTTGKLGSGAVVDNATLAFNRSDAISVGNTISGTGSVVQAGSGTLTLTAANTYTGGTTVNSGTLALGNVAALGSASGAITVAGGALDLGGFSETAGTVTLSGGSIQNGTLNGASYATSSGTVSAILAGSGALTKSGAGTVILTGANTYTGGTTITGGTLQIGNGVVNGVMGSGAYAVSSGAALYLNQGASPANPVWGNITGAGTLILGDASSSFVNYSRPSLTAGFTGTLQLNNRGRITATPTNLGGTTRVVMNDGAQFLAFDGTTAGTAYTFAQNFSLSGLGSESGYSYGALRVSGLKATFSGNLTLTGDSGLFLQNNAGGAMNITGVIADGGAGYGLSIAARLASGAITLSGANTYSGLTTTASNTGTLILNNTNALQNSTLNQTAGTLAFSSGVTSNAFTLGGLSGTSNIALRNNAVTPAAIALSVGKNNTSTSYSGVLSSTGSLVKVGSGTLTLSGNNTYTGGTTVNAGRLLAGSNSAFGTGAVTVNSGGTLSVGLLGAGRSLANTVTVASGGALAGTASLSGGVTLASGAAYVWSIVNSAPTIAGTDFDRLVITAGTFTLNSGSILKIDASGTDYSTAFWDSGHTFSFVTKSGTGTIAGTFSALDTSSAGIFSGQGSWSFASNTSGLSAVWTASSGMQGMSSSLASTQAVPEPATYGLLGAGALAAAAMVRRRRKIAV